MPTIPTLKNFHQMDKPKLMVQSHTYYNTPEWKRLRCYYIRLHPLCEKCLANDKITPADQVHHRIPFMTGMTHDQRISLLLDITNLESVCKDCHIEVHRQLKSNKQ